MAKQRWGTFSVADHLNVRSLVPDVLLFDRLIFPYSSDKGEWTYWNKEGWDPALLDYCFLKLEELVLPVEWGDKERKEFRSNMVQSEALEELTFAPGASTVFRILPQSQWWRAENPTFEVRSPATCGH
jgi:hypothetical protein